MTHNQGKNSRRNFLQLPLATKNHSFLLRRWGNPWECHWFWMRLWFQLCMHFLSSSKRSISIYSSIFPRLTPNPRKKRRIATIFTQVPFASRPARADPTHSPKHKCACVRATRKHHTVKNNTLKFILCFRLIPGAKKETTEWVRGRTYRILLFGNLYWDHETREGRRLCSSRVTAERCLCLCALRAVAGRSETFVFVSCVC